jgi:DNA-binding transcriptional LysR family regulator
MNLVDLDAFVRVADAGSITGGAASLGVPKSTVSRRVTRLEDALGVQLLARGARRVTLTDHGRLLHERSRAALREIGDVERDLVEAEGEPRGTLRVTAPADFGGSRGLAEVIASFRRKHREVALEIELTNRVVDLVEEGFDVALRPRGVLADTDELMGKPVVRATGGGLFASAAYVEEHGVPRSIEALARHACITHAAPALRSYQLRRGARGPIVLVKVDAAIVVNSFSMMLSFVLSGAGIGLLYPTFEARAHIGSQKLVRVLPRYTTVDQELWVVWPRHRHTAPRVRAFLDHLATESARVRLIGP